MWPALSGSPRAGHPPVAQLGIAAWDRSLNDDCSMITVLLFDTSADLRFCITDLPVDEFVNDTMVVVVFNVPG